MKKLQVVNKDRTEDKTFIIMNDKYNLKETSFSEMERSEQCPLGKTPHFQGFCLRNTIHGKERAATETAAEGNPCCWKPLPGSVPHMPYSETETDECSPQAVHRDCCRCGLSEANSNWSCPRSTNFTGIKHAKLKVHRVWTIKKQTNRKPIKESKLWQDRNLCKEALKVSFSGDSWIWKKIESFGYCHVTIISKINLLMLEQSCEVTQC